jgi:hypothetical protein
LSLEITYTFSNNLTCFLGAGGVFDIYQVPTLIPKVVPLKKDIAYEIAFTVD